MSSSSKLRDANTLIDGRAPNVSAFMQAPTLLLLHLLFLRGALTLDQIALELGTREIADIINQLSKDNFVEANDDRYRLTDPTRRRLNYGRYTLEFLVGSRLTGHLTLPQTGLSGTYEVEQVIGRGSTSCTFLAEQSGTYTKRTLKVFFPHAIQYDTLADALRRFASIDKKPAAFPEIVDAGEITVSFPDGLDATLCAVVLTYIDHSALTLATFLQQQQKFTSAIFDHFIEDVGGALAALERLKLQHGDLHERNILALPQDSGAVAFKVIDFIGVPGFSSSSLTTRTDLDNFRDHLLVASITACRKHPGVSARVLMGDRAFATLEGLRNQTYKSFEAILKDFYRSTETIPSDYFTSPAPKPFDWLRVEWIPSSSWLYKLFYPVPSRFDTLSRFGNTWISGPRGCGKSHYLRILAFQPTLYAIEDHALATKLKDLNYDFRRSFGILFSCRLGEFKGFTPEALGAQEFDTETQRYVKHILILKIWNRALSSILRGLETIDYASKRPVLEAPSRTDELVSFLGSRLGPITLLGNDQSLEILRQCFAVASIAENSAVANWNKVSLRTPGRLLADSDLDDFFAVVNQSFPDLRLAQFYILVDDASYGQIHFEVQKLLNSLVRAAQAHHCFKITADRYMYTLDSSDGRQIAIPDEATYVDLGEVSTKSQKDAGFDYSKYMAEVINLRLRAEGYESTIQELLGRSQRPTEFLHALSLPRSVRPGMASGQRGAPKSRAYYAGWNIVCNIAHGSVRTLLELVETIFRDANVSFDTSTVSLDVQDASVRSYSRRRFKSIPILVGEIEGEPIGPQLQHIVGAIGEMSRQYLRNYNTGEEGRWYETISLERLAQGPLSGTARRLLSDLLKDGLLLDEGVTFTRAQIGLAQRYDLNKIFAPAFEVTYRVRNHIFLSDARLEELLRSPDNFVARHRRKLEELTISEAGPYQSILFAESADGDLDG